MRVPEKSIWRERQCAEKMRRRKNPVEHWHLRNKQRRSKYTHMGDSNRIGLNLGENNIMETEDIQF